MTTASYAHPPPMADLAPTSLRRALDEAVSVLGPDNVTRPGSGDVLEPRRNVGFYASRSVHAVLRPGTVDDVRAVLAIFRRHRPGAALHAVSTGRNWGLGSAEPTTGGVVTLDMGRMGAIRALDRERGWAVVEPGVTQRRLAERLVGSRRMLNVTASSGHTSVIGNALERGVGLRRQRTEDLLGLEVVLADGACVRVGWWPDTSAEFADAPTAMDPYGLGPSLLHLFTQSNLAVVTAAVVRLMPRPEAQDVLRLTFPPERLGAAVDTLQRWVAQELVSGVLKVYDAASATNYGGLPGENLALICVSGTRERVAALTGVIRREADASGLFTSAVASSEEPASRADTVLQVVERAYAGDPSRNEDMLAAATGQDADHVDSDGGGWLFFLALVPFDGESMARAAGLVAEIGRETGLPAGTTVNALSSDVIDLVVSLKFAPSEEATARAHRALDLIYERFVQAGFRPYRLDIDHAAWRRRLASPGTLALTERLETLLDPDGIIAPGRYAA